MAHCVSVETERPARSDRFLLDTNVILFVAYQVLSGDLVRAKRNAYSGFLDRCRTAGSELYVCGLSFSEVAGTAERFRWKEYGGADVCEQKAFRKIAPQRSLVLADLQQVWDDITKVASVVSATNDKQAVERVATVFGTASIDGYDGFLIDVAQQEKIPNIVTDDGDFALASNLVVFTANRSLLD